uniref:C-type lectin domain-containing protein n=1 Tax=Acrobeloides nanus TaxID=290746 RepID=A0A914CAF6_9BILA
MFLKAVIALILFVNVSAHLLKPSTNDTLQRHRRGVFDADYVCGNDEFEHEEGAIKKWGKKSLTYYIESFGHSESEDEIRKGLGDAFYQWSNWVDIIFTEVNDTDADITIGFKRGELSDGFTFKENQLAHCSGKMPCTKIWFNDAYSFRYVRMDRWLFSKIDFLTVALHQIGHALGLEHLEHEEAIMNKKYTRPAGKTDVYIWPKLRSPDIRAIRELYDEKEDFDAMHKNCHNYWENHKWATYYDKTDKHYVIQKVENYPQAQNYCRAIGGSLASIHSGEENLFIAKFGKEKLKPAKVAFIGLTRPESEWRWEDNTPVTYTNWNFNEPNNELVEKWVLLDTQSENGGWRNVYDEWYYLAICQVQCPKSEKPVHIEPTQDDGSKPVQIEPTQDDGSNQFHKDIAKLYSFHGLFLLIAIIFVSLSCLCVLTKCISSSYISKKYKTYVITNPNYVKV